MNPKTELGLRMSIYTASLILLIFFFDTLTQLIIANTSIPYWNNIINLKTAIICFFILIFCFEIWFLSYNKIKKLFLKNEYFIYLIIIIIFLITNLVIQFTSPTSGDIRHTAHVGFLISQGMQPYVDFFEFHNPLYGYVMALIFLLFNGMVSIYVLHVITFVILALSALFVYKIGKTIFRDKKKSLWMVILFISFKNILVSYNIRFDVFATLFVIISIFYLIKATKLKEYSYSGFFIALSFLFVQKSLLHILGIIIIIFITNIKNIKKQISKLYYFILGLSIPLIIFYIFLYFYTGVEGLKRYYTLNFLFINEMEWHFSTFDKLLSYFITNGASLLCAIIGLIIFIKYYKEIQKYKIVLGVLLLNFAIGIFFIVKGGRISPQDFMYFFPFLTISGVVTIRYISKKMNAPFKKYFYFPFIIWLLVIPFTLTALNIIVPSDNHEIVFYLNNFKGEKTNCNFIFHPLDRYYFYTDSYWWLKEEGGSKDFFRKHKIEFENPSLEEMIDEKYKIICIEMDMKHFAREKLINNSYYPYQHAGKISKIIYIKK